MNGIFYDGRLMAQIGSSGRVLLEPHVAALDEADSLRRFVVAMAQYAVDVVAGELPGPYDPKHAQAYARALLMPADEIEPGASAEAVAERFGAPLEQAKARLRELGRDG